MSSPKSDVVLIVMSALFDMTSDAVLHMTDRRRHVCIGALVFELTRLQVCF